MNKVGFLVCFFFPQKLSSMPFEFKGVSGLNPFVNIL